MLLAARAITQWAHADPEQQARAAAAVAAAAGAAAIGARVHTWRDTRCESGSGKLGWRRRVARGGGGQVRRRAFLGLGLGFLYFFDFFGFFSVQVILFNRSLHGIIDYPMRST